MVWSLFKIVIFMATVAGLAFGLIHLLESEEMVLITVAGREYALTPLVTVIAALVLLAAVWLLFRLAGLLVAALRFLNGDETAISRYFNRRGEQKGYQALADGMLALASGEGRLAVRKAQRAEHYLKRPDITNLIVAQGAEMVGDHTLTTNTMKALLQDDRTRFVGVRGLMKQKLEAGDSETALKLAEKALALRPQHKEVQDTLFQLQVQYEDWRGARQTLIAKLKSGHLPRDVHRRRDAVLALAQARDTLASGQVAEARQIAEDANRLSPDLVPAAVMAARMAIDEGKPRVAAHVIRKAWDVAPHPDLVAAFAAVAPDETPAERLKRFHVLLARHPGHAETRLLDAEMKIAAKDFAAARTALGDLAETAPGARSLTIMAAIERGQGSEDQLVRAWLAKAVTASRGPHWICGNCGHIHTNWRPLCSNCDSFDTLSWQEIPQSDAALTRTTQMLPLIVGALEDQRKVTDATMDAEDAEGGIVNEASDDSTSTPETVPERVDAQARN
ncbi:MAG: heme biosynthesis protein HemY [Rhodobacteraceae bacterium]|nr:heme biosynthesis protein HemY [Paracoccaceae bacterium]